MPNTAVGLTCVCFKVHIYIKNLKSLPQGAEEVAVINYTFFILYVYLQYILYMFTMSKATLFKKYYFTEKNYQKIIISTIILLKKVTT